ncbi:MAG: family 1 encapsulin nanocompartment shell protein [Rhodovibrionaceae bacterium]|nr:family 1 encapsulin nanocompartment shell protein [Rhodovibrionaceae bacterium]
MNHLLRHLAPITEEAWAEIEEDATRALKTTLAGRKLVDFKGPLGWDCDSVQTGRSKALKKAPQKSVKGRLREVQPLCELRVAFTLSLSELESISRGAEDAELGPVIDAARAIAMAEDAAIFHGFAEAGIVGICDGAEAGPVSLSTDYLKYPTAVTEALRLLREAGVGGPYGIALGPRCFKGLQETTRDGYPVMDHVRQLVDGPLVWAPAVDGAVVMSLRGGDYELSVGQDLSIGYTSMEGDKVNLYIEESFTFRNLTPEAGVPLVYGKK